MDHVRINKDRGAILILIVAIVLLLVLAGLTHYASRELSQRLDKKNVLQSKLDRLETALTNFVVQHKRLPCPADGRIASDAANVGIEISFPSCNQQQFGVVPWVTLGISEDDAIDIWGARISYRVDPALASSVTPLMNMSNCDVSGTGSVAIDGTCRTPTPTCVANPTTCTSPTTFLAGKGLDVWDGVGGPAGWATRVNNRITGSGAAFLLISHGETGAGAYNRRGNYQPGLIGPISLAPLPGTQFAGNNEMPNINNQVLVLPATQSSTFRDTQRDTSRTLNNFDDVVRHPTISSILRRAALHERVH